LEHGGSSDEEGVEQPAGVPSGLHLVVMEWMVTITGDHVGYPGFSGFGAFFSEEKSFWRKILGEPFSQSSEFLVQSLVQQCLVR
jgi:hypothetical protein